MLRNVNLKTRAISELYKKLILSIHKNVIFCARFVFIYITENLRGKAMSKINISKHFGELISKKTQTSSTNPFSKPVKKGTSQVSKALSSGDVNGTTQAKDAQSQNGDLASKWMNETPSLEKMQKALGKGSGSNAKMAGGAAAASSSQAPRGWFTTAKAAAAAAEDTAEATDSVNQTEQTEQAENEEDNTNKWENCSLEELQEAWNSKKGPDGKPLTEKDMEQMEECTEKIIQDLKEQQKENGGIDPNIGIATDLSKSIKAEIGSAQGETAAEDASAEDANAEDADAEDADAEDADGKGKVQSKTGKTPEEKEKPEGTPAPGPEKPSDPTSTSSEKTDDSDDADDTDTTKSKQSADSTDDSSDDNTGSTGSSNPSDSGQGSGGSGSPSGGGQSGGGCGGPQQQQQKPTNNTPNPNEKPGGPNTPAGPQGQTGPTTGTGDDSGAQAAPKMDIAQEYGKTAEACEKTGGETKELQSKVAELGDDKLKQELTPRLDAASKNVEDAKKQNDTANDCNVKANDAQGEANKAGESAKALDPKIEQKDNDIEKTIDKSKKLDQEEKDILKEAEKKKSEISAADKRAQAAKARAENFEQQSTNLGDEIVADKAQISLNDVRINDLQAIINAETDDAGENSSALKAAAKQQLEQVKSENTALKNSVQAKEAHKQFLDQQAKNARQEQTENETAKNKAETELGKIKDEADKIKDKLEDTLKRKLNNLQNDRDQLVDRQEELKNTQAEKATIANQFGEEAQAAERNAKSYINNANNENQAVRNKLGLKK